MAAEVVSTISLALSLCAYNAGALRIFQPQNVQMVCSPDDEGCIEEVKPDPKHAEFDELLMVDVATRHDYIRGGLETKYTGAPPGWYELLNTTAGDANLPKELWMFWEQGIENMTIELNQVCVAQWAKLNPHWRQNIWSSKTVQEAYPELGKLFDRMPRRISHRADMLRLWLLADFGGVWADASLLPLVPLDHFIAPLVKAAGFWTWTFEHTSTRPVTSWFLAAVPNNSLVLRWKEEFMKRWDNSSYEFAYFEVHHTLKDLIDQDERDVSSVWNRMPMFSQHWPHSCIGGCLNYWNVTDPKSRPPMLKRPFQGNGTPPEEWWAGYWRALNQEDNPLS